MVDSVAWVARLALLGVGTIQLRAKNLDDVRGAADRHRRARDDEGHGGKARGQRLLARGDRGRRKTSASRPGRSARDADLKAIRDAGLTLGLSTHDDAELETALRARPDYIALGPIFPTTLKSMRFAPQGIAEDHRMEEAHRRHPAGRDRRHQARTGAREIFAAGADSIAVVSDVTQNPDPDARVRAWLGLQRGGRVMEFADARPTPALARKRERERTERLSSTLPLAGEGGVARQSATGGGTFRLRAQ